MNKICLTISLMLLPAVVTAQHSAMTYNLRYNTPNDGVNQWEIRKDWVVGLIRYYEPGILGIQEGTHEQVSYLDSLLTGYKYVGVGRDDGKTGGEYSAVFYRTDLYEVLETETFWLSDNPDKVSVGWDASMERISTLAHLQSRTSKTEFLVYNAHLDHIGEQSRLNALKLIHKKAGDRNQANLPVLIMGDFNALPDSPPINFLNEETIFRDAKEVSQNPPYGPEGTFNGFDTAHPLDVRIDYIFVSTGVQVHKYGVLADTRNQRTPSDHLPVLIHFGIH